MKLFITKLTALLLIMATIFTGYDAIYRRICDIDPSKNDEYKFQSVPEGIQIGNFGTSHGRLGFDYSDWQEEFITFNFALTAQTLSYDYRILQQYIDRFAENGTVFIPISYISFGWDEEARPDFKSKNERYYSFLESKYIKDYDWITDIGLKHFLPLLYEPDKVISNIRKSLEKKAAGSEADHTDEEQEFSETQTEDGEEDLRQLSDPNRRFKESAERKREVHYLVDENGDLTVREEELSALYGIIDLCREHHLRPILITTPFRREYNDVFDEKFYRQFYAVIDTVCQDEAVEYYDYSHDERFIDSTEYFNDADHLSPEGAVVFTDMVIRSCVDT